jgi:hypothetical protein
LGGCVPPQLVQVVAVGPMEKAETVLTQQTDSRKATAMILTAFFMESSLKFQ